MKVLIVEDEPKLVGFLKQGLEEQGFETDVAYDGLIGKKLAERNNYDLALIDIIIPHINGIELSKIIKNTKPHLPVIMLTALGTTEDKVAGFDAGADDYLVKPFEFKELLARIRAVTKRSAGFAETSLKLRAGDIELDLDKKVAIREGKVIELTSKEFGLLEYFMRNNGKVLSRSNIAEKVWDINFDTGTNIVDVYVNILRKKIDKDFSRKHIHTRIGLGYIFRDE